MLKGVFINAKTGTAEVMEIEPKLENYYKLLDCQKIDIVNRRVGRYRFDIICDDEGLFTEAPVVTMIDYLFRPMLVGNLFICSHDERGNEKSLTRSQINEVLNNILDGKLMGGY